MVVSERVLSSGVTGAETFGERSVALLPLYEGAFGVCVEATPFRIRVNFVGDLERGVGLALAIIQLLIKLENGHSWSLLTGSSSWLRCNNFT